MRNLSSWAICICSLGLFFLSACGEGKQSDAKDADPTEAAAAQEVEPTEIFNNDYARVAKISLAPGEVLAAHEGGPRVIYSLSDYTIDWEENGEEKGVKSWKEGDVHFHEAGMHAATNSGDSRAEWLAFVRKTDELPECPEDLPSNDVQAVAPGFSNLLFDNEEFRVVEIALPPGEKIAPHAGINRLIYSLSDYRIRNEAGGEEKSAMAFESGDVHWHEACEHALENIGQTEARFLVVAFKQ